MTFSSTVYSKINDLIFFRSVMQSHCSDILSNFQMLNTEPFKVPFKACMSPHRTDSPFIKIDFLKSKLGYEQLSSICIREDMHYLSRLLCVHIVYIHYIRTNFIIHIAISSMIKKHVFSR